MKNFIKYCGLIIAGFLYLFKASAATSKSLDPPVPHKTFSLLSSDRELDQNKESVYVGISPVSGFPLSFYQAGWNRDRQCYPGSAACQAGKHTGYAWIYKIAPQGLFPGLELYAGLRTHKNIRLELSANGMTGLQSLKTRFIGLYYRTDHKKPFLKTAGFWDGLILPQAKEFSRGLTNTQSISDERFISAQNSFSHFQILSLFTNIYADFPFALAVLNPPLAVYFGIGAGASLVRARIGYSSQYKNRALNTEQKAVFEKLALSARLKAGFAYKISQKIKLAGEGAYSMIKAGSGKLPYKKHPFQSFTTICYETSVF